MSASVVRGDALRIPLRDASVDLIVTSPPYFSQRSYRDTAFAVGPDGKVLAERVHFWGQLGSEPTPQAFLEALWAVTAECWRVLKPTGSMFVNLGDKRSGSGGHNNSSISNPNSFHVGTGRKSVTSPDALRIQAEARAVKATRRNAPDRYNQAAFGRPKSKMLLPHRFAIGCEDGLADPDGIGWIVRQDIVWNKPNGLPESVTDRVRDSHEGWFHLSKGDVCFWAPDELATLPDAHEWVFHLVKQGRYFSAVDEVREAHAEGAWDKGPRSSYKPGSASGSIGADGEHQRKSDAGLPLNPLGKVPGSVWQIASEPLVIPESVKAHYGLPDHFAAFPQEWPRRLILGWSPSGVCTACGEGRRPVVAKTAHGSPRGQSPTDKYQRVRSAVAGGPPSATEVDYTITGYACACPEPAPTTPSVVLDPFGGTGTVAGVARALGRTGVNLDLSMDYCRLAAWFLKDGRRFGKAASRTDRERQGDLFADPFRSAVDVPTGTAL